MRERAISVNREIYNKPFTIPKELPSNEKINITLYLPPCDVPLCIEPEFNQKEDTFSIIFKYHDKEDEIQLFNKDDIKFIIGKHSGKPLRIEICKIRQNKVSVVSLTNVINENVRQSIKEKFYKYENVRQKQNLLRATEVMSQSASILDKNLKENLSQIIAAQSK